ncbi:MAG: hypothetical protein ACLQGN_12390 [Mycobacterium sp.]|uniref:hypothetical protein n=1 Tax=Mycobacterium sp. TaxID=1785 RepID=UPI003F9CC91F
MIKQLICAALLAATAMTVAGTAGADPTPAPGPYQILGPNGPVVGGLPTYPTRCLAQPRACAMTWNPNTGAWEAPGTGSP